jgi:hypothetical protein
MSNDSFQQARDKIMDYVKNGKDILQLKELSREEINEIHAMTKVLAEEAFYENRGFLRRLGYI